MDRPHQQRVSDGDAAETPSPSAKIELRRGYQPGLIGRVGELHGAYYASTWGAGAPFEILIVRDLCEFLEGYDPAHDLILSAWLDGKIIGSISMLGERIRSEEAQLRFFIVDPAYQGFGAGSLLLASALDWCRRNAYKTVFLWTVDHLPQSRRLYEKSGFVVVERHWDDRYTVPRDNLKMQLSLAAG